MNQKRKISPGFVVVMVVLVAGVSAFLYTKENEKFRNASSATALIVTARNVPKRCEIEARVESGHHKDKIIHVSVPSWDTREIGERIGLRVDRHDISIAEVDEILYLHRSSLGVLAGSLVLMFILIGVSIFKKS